MSDDMMTFPKTIEEFINQYSFTDSKQYYTNGSTLIPTFRVKQALEHYCPNRTFQNKPVKFCPFRKVTSAYYYESELSPKVVTEMSNAEWTEEQFAPCLKEKCLAYCEQNIGYITTSFCKLMN
jgi:hypothetical protein